MEAGRPTYRFVLIGYSCVSDSSLGGGGRTVRSYQARVHRGTSFGTLIMVMLMIALSCVLLAQSYLGLALRHLLSC